MLFLLEYDRQAGKLVKLEAFETALRAEVSKARLSLEISLMEQGIRHEVVILEAESESDLRRTHNRYFGDVAELANSMTEKSKLSP
ncbi:MAG: hypothetical protein QM719_05720 [Thermomonas sp.]